jgi:sulfatase maturation enzyme AslB (radical SAM superfamily)
MIKNNTEVNLKELNETKSIEITTNIGCKNLCSYCPQSVIVNAYTRRSNLLQMSYEIFQKCLDSIPTDTILIFSGMSEPWLNPNIKEMLLYSLQKGYKIFLSTTLIGMKPEDVSFLKSLKSLQQIHIHLPSANGKERIEVDNNYLQILDELSKSNIKIVYRTHDTVHPALKTLSIKDYGYCAVTTRAGNIKSNLAPKIKRGEIKCERNLNHPVLLPNGDVILCCMDFGMKHFLGNLLSCDYESLFNSKEFLKVKAGMRGAREDILCRNCEYAYNLNPFVRFCNSVMYCLYHEGMFTFFKRGILKLIRGTRRLRVRL